MGETITEANRGPAGAVQMPYLFDFDFANEILRCRLTGEVNDDVLKDFFRGGAEYAAHTRPKAGVVDLSEVTSFEASARTIREVARSTPVFRDQDVRRVVIAPSSTIYGMMRMFEIEGEDKRPNLHVVRSEREAWAILAVENPQFDPLEKK
jgi:hypothetical protein